MRKQMLAALAVCAVLASGCATLKGQFSTKDRVHGAADVANDTVFTSLSTLQDAEMFAFKQGLIPVGEYTPKTDTAAEVCTGHRCFNAKLLVALEAGRALNKSMMTWQPGTPMPDSVRTVMGTVSNLSEAVLATLPDSPTKSKLLLYSGAVQTAVLDVITKVASGGK